MSEFTQALGLVAPYYNLALVAVVIVLFIKLFRAYQKSRLGHIKPWIFIFLGVMVYVAEAIFTVVRSAGIFNLPYHVNGYFEFAIITLFIYALLSKREHIKAGGGIVLASSVSKSVSKNPKKQTVKTSKVKKKVKKKSKRKTSKKTKRKTSKKKASKKSKKKKR